MARVEVGHPWGIVPGAARLNVVNDHRTLVVIKMSWRTMDWPPASIQEIAHCGGR
jgi:hypothetical protein